MRYIGDFRVRNEKALSETFLQVLKLAKERGVLKVGTVSVDGTKIKANASIRKSLRYDRAGQLEGQLELEIAELMTKAKEADNSDAEGKAELAQEKLENRAKDKAGKQKQTKPGDKDDPEDPPPPPLPEAREQGNLTDHESRIMRKNNRSSSEQAYNAQAVVTVLADTGYANGTTVQKRQGQGLKVLVALGRQTENGHKHHDFRPVSARPQPSRLLRNGRNPGR